MNYFELFKIEQKFLIDLTKLNDNYFELQKSYHPDRIMIYGHSFEEFSSLINNGYRTLSDDLLRAKYMLKSIYKIDLDDEKNYTLDSNVLFEVMENQETLSFINDSTNLNNLLNEQNEIKNKKIHNLALLFDQKQELDEIVKKTVELIYINKFIKDIKTKLREL